MFKSFLYSIVLGTLHSIFQSYHPGYCNVVCKFAKQNPRRLFFYHVISPDTLEDCFKTEILGFCHSVEWTSFKPWCNLWILNYLGSWDRADLPKPKVDKDTQLSQVPDLSAIEIHFRSEKRKDFKYTLISYMSSCHFSMSVQYFCMGIPFAVFSESCKMKVFILLDKSR